MTTFVFDIDGTICNNTQGNYHLAKPFWERIELVNHLFQDGHTVILYTARGMGSSSNRIEEASEKWKKFTEDQLFEWGLKYHQIFFGKPAGDFYIDDKAIHESEFFAKYS
jgi:ribonucleotide monophosphatase NagD (HAD superfamily)